MPGFLEARKVKKRYCLGGVAVPALHGVSFEVNYPIQNETFAEAGDKITLTLETFVQPAGAAQPIPVLENVNFTVGGVLQKKPTSGITDFDYWVFLPLARVQQIYGTSEYDLTFVRVKDPEQSENIAKSIQQLFPPFSITILVPSTFVKEVDNILTSVQIFLTAIASISLLVEA